jgi:transcriptional regulator with XRE-family HTH domain
MSRRSVDVVDNRTEIREFLATRRAKITPEQAGVPLYGGKRRVPGLRREEVAMLAGVSTDYYTRLEKGNINGVSDEVLSAVAGALQLDEAERAHLFDLARAAKPTRAPRRRTQPGVRPSVQRILDSMASTPAFVRNGRLDVLAINPLGRALYVPVFDDPTRLSVLIESDRKTKPGTGERHYRLGIGCVAEPGTGERDHQEVTR